MSESNYKIHTTLDHLFRHEYAKLVSLLTRKYGPQRIDMIENAVQDALLKAMQMWPYAQQPENPTAWLYRVANNRLLDLLRKSGREITETDFPEKAQTKQATQAEEMDAQFEDQQLNMIFACCHPALKPAEQIMLSLKLLCGFSVHEIGRALLKKDEAVKKAISRAKATFRKHDAILDIPSGRELIDRLDSVLKVLYLMFNEGYKSTGGEALLNRDMCEDAIRLALLLRQHDRCKSDELSALIALMCFNASRFPARLNEKGELQTLEQQDRRLWDRDYLKMAVYFLSESSTGLKLSRYHLEAGIASHYSLAEDYRKTDWRAILFLYNRLIREHPSPVAHLNRVVVIQKCEGAKKALTALDNTAAQFQIQQNYLYYSIRSDIYLELDKKEKARACLCEAITRAENVVEKNFLQRKLDALPAES